MEWRATGRASAPKAFARVMDLQAPEDAFTCPDTSIARTAADKDNALRSEISS